MLTEATLPVASVARRLGVAPSTLRTWDRRYGVGPSKHTGGRHRRYGSADIGRLELMQRALLRGASTAEAARYALERMPKARPASTGNSGLGAVPASALHVDTPEGAVVFSGAAEAPELPGPAQQARLLGAAARAMDVRSLQRLLAQVLAELGALRAWDQVLHPVLTALRAPGGSAGNAQTGAYGEAVASLLAECVFEALTRANPVLAEPRNPRPVLLACAQGERDRLPLYVLAAALGRRSVAAQPFWVHLPAEVLAATVRRSQPAAVVLWAGAATAGETIDVGVLPSSARPRNRGRLFACGPGWDRESLPPQVELLDELAGAVDRVARLIG